MATYTFLGQKIGTPFVIRSNQPAFSSDTITLSPRRSKQDVQRWELSFPLTIDDPSNFFPDYVSNLYSPIAIEMPQLNIRGESIFLGTATGNVFTAATNAGETQVNMAAASGTIKKGRFIKFASHDKIYVLTADWPGSGVMNIFPSLRASVGATTVKYQSDVTFTGYIDDSADTSFVYSDGILAQANITLLEAV